MVGTGSADSGRDLRQNLPRYDVALVSEASSSALDLFRRIRVCVLCISFCPPPIEFSR